MEPARSCAAQRRRRERGCDSRAFAMSLPSPIDPASAAQASPAAAPSVVGHGAPAAPRSPQGARIDWDDWLRTVERRRRGIARAAGDADGKLLPLPADFYVAATAVSFQI